MPNPGEMAARVAPARSTSDSAIGASAQRKAAWRLLPILAIGYGMAFMDRINISFASLRMNDDLHFSATVYGIGAGVFFIGYALCEVPSNLLMLRFGARRWLMRIMFTWGLLATSMMLVRTPLQFYTVRLLLGISEAGFFPGVIYYLTLWFPAPVRARAISRFYISGPISLAVSGALAGWLMGLDGKLGLTGWQWLFLAEGLPTALFSVLVFLLLPDSPAHAAWLTSEEKQWLQSQLSAEAAEAHIGREAGVMKALLSPKVWMIGLFLFCACTCFYGYFFSAPAILEIATGWKLTQVGFLVAAIGLGGTVAMLLGGISSDRTGERSLHCMVPCGIMAICFVLAGFARPGWLVVDSLALMLLAFSALLGPATALPTQFLAGPACAAGIAAMNSITMFSGFVGPYWMGRMKDLTGSYWPGLRGLAIPALAGVGIMVALTRSLARGRPPQPTAELADEPA
ncbi:MAG TPA: MFS transporter [Terracidiphilus sp.]|nr:MFS transporter [Terracidiphilus sp.]